MRGRARHDHVPFGDLVLNVIMENGEGGRVRVVMSSLSSLHREFCEELQKFLRAELLAGCAGGDDFAWHFLLRFFAVEVTVLRQPILRH